MLEAFAPTVQWIVVLGFVAAFILAFGMGANDVANSFGTSVGSGVLSLRNACWLGTVCEISGAVLIGYKVSDTLRKGILDVTVYENSEVLLMLGFLSALSSSATWLLLATYIKLPVSSTHSMVGSIIGYSLVARGPSGLQWDMLVGIVGSWFLSPILSGLMSCALYWTIRTFILRADRPLQAGLRSLPLIYGITVAVNVMAIVDDGPEMLALHNISRPMAIAISLSLGILVAIIVQLFAVPAQRRAIVDAKKVSQPASINSPRGSNNNAAEPNGDDMQNVEIGSPGSGAAAPLSPASRKVPLIAPKHDAATKVDEAEGVSALFSFLQILTAAFASFVHGGSDVSNAIGPLIALWMIYKEGTVLQESETPVSLLFFGGIGISLGLWLWGRRVIETMGQHLTKITPSTGFTIEFGAAFTVLLASKMAMPISTTHCMVGSVVLVGYVSAPPYSEEDKRAGLPRPQAVDWSLFRKIIYAWVVTVPVTGLFSAAIMFVLIKSVPV